MEAHIISGTQDLVGDGVAQIFAVPIPPQPDSSYKIMACLIDTLSQVSELGFAVLNQGGNAFRVKFAGGAPALGATFTVSWIITR